MRSTRLVPLALATAVLLTGLAAPAHAAPVRPRMQGVVVDQGGRHVDDVPVQAVRGNGSVAASALTYASDRTDGPHHGYFYLAVGGADTYDVTLSKPGYRSADLGEYAVTRRGVVSLGEVLLERKRVPSTTRLSLPDRTLTATQRAGAAVKVVTAATNRPVGEVARGAHTVKAVWHPMSSYVKGSTSAPVDVTVRGARGRTVAASRGWLPGSPLLRVLQ